ncbi:MAG: haloacid dehalogenase type II [Candidatus Limnocylindrales bacterium]
MADLDFAAFDAMTFDCYGTLIDWETGILAALRPLLGSASAGVGDDGLLEDFGRAESSVEAGPYRRYREVLAEVARTIAGDLGVSPSDPAVAAFGGSVVYWPPFPDSSAALARLHERFRLGVITNCDDDLFAASAVRLGTEFDWVITAQQALSYKPSERNFQLAFERIDVPRERILHVAQSLFHDHVPAKRLGMSTVWVDRRHGRAGGGATLPATATPDLTVPDMATLAQVALG